MMWERVFLGLGSNMGDRIKNLDSGQKALVDQNYILINSVSQIFESEPMYFSEQDSFLNLVMEIQTTLTPFELLQIIKNIEISAGRSMNSLRNRPRTLDIDIICYEETKIHTKLLTIPHPKLSERNFVLIPWAEIAPEFTPPGYDQTVAELLINNDNKSQVCLYQKHEMSLS